MAKLSTAILTILLTTSAAYASTTEWTSQVYRNVTTSTIESDRGSFSVSCSREGLELKFIQGGRSFTNADTQDLKVQIDGRAVIPVSGSWTREAANNIYKALGEIRSGQTLTVSAGQYRDQFTLKDARRHIAPVGVDCYLTIDKPAY